MKERERERESESEWENVERERERVKILEEFEFFRVISRFSVKVKVDFHIISKFFFESSSLF